MTLLFPHGTGLRIGAAGAAMFSDIINADRITGYVVAARALELGWNGVDLLNFTVTLKANVWLLGRIGFDTGLYPAGSSVSFIVEPGAYWGGIGGKGADYSAYPGSISGEAGGIGLKARSPLIVDNQGVGFGGGGGGGRGGHATHAHGGGGGGGRPLGPAGEGVPPYGAYYGGGGTFGSLPGTAGTKLAKGLSGGGGSGAGNGGDGGDWAAAGAPGSSGNLAAGGAGGAAGNCVEGNALITWTDPGTRHGAIVA